MLILEDDVDFTPAAVSWGRPNDCDIAYGGYFPADPNDLQSTDIIGAHCIGFSARAAQALAPFLSDLLDASHHHQSMARTYGSGDSETDFELSSPSRSSPSSAHSRSDIPPRTASTRSPCSRVRWRDRED